MPNLIDSALGTTGAPAAPASTIQDQISHAASMAGVPVDIATRLVKQESSFNPRAKSPAGAMGLTQLMPGTARMLGVTNPYDPTENLAGGFKYLAQLHRQFGNNWAHALAAYNWGPGNVTAWLRHGGNPHDLPAETRAYLASILPSEPTAAPTQVAAVNLVDQALGHRNLIDKAVSERTVAQAPAHYHLQRSLASMLWPALAGNAQHSAMDELGGALGILPVLATGMTESRLAGHGEFGKEFQRAWQTYQRDPAQASDTYGMGAPAADQFALAHAAPGSMEARSAHFDLTHPWAPAAEAFGESLIDPVNMAVGRALDPVVAPAFRKLRDALSPFRDIAAGVGHRAASAVRAFASRMQSHVGAVNDEVEHIFGGLTPEEKIDVLRRSEPGAKGSVTSDTDLDARAKRYRAFIKRVTAEQQAAHPGLLPAGRVFNPDLYHPLKGAYKDPELNQETQDILGDLQSSQSSGGLNVRKGSAGVGGGHKTLSAGGIRGALLSGLLRDDWDPAASLRRWGTRRLQNAEFERSMRRLPAALRRDIEAGDYVNGLGRRMETPFARSAAERAPDTLARAVAENHARFPVGHPERFALAPQDGMVPTSAALPGIGSPTLQESLVHPSLANFLRARGGSVLGGMPTRAWNLALPNGAKIPLGDMLDRYNTVMRSAIIANPLFHPVWNLRENMASAGEMPIAALRQTLKTIVGAVSHKGYDWWDGADSKLFHEASQKSDAYAQAVKDAVDAGATAEMHPTSSALGADVAHIRTSPYKSLTTAEKADKFLTSLRDWNSRSTFGPTGEQAFSTKLFGRLKSLYPHASPEEVGNMVRDALGGYQDVDPNNPMSRLFFFYPWLKGNALHWMQMMFTRPGYMQAPLQAERRYNEATGDPNFRAQPGGALYPTADFRLHTGKPGEGTYTTLPFPQRVAADIVNSVMTGRPSNMLYTADNLIRGHANPIVGNILDAFATGNKPAGSPALPANYNLIMQKNAPPGEQWKQTAGYLLSHDVPIPLVQFAVQDAVRRGLSPQSFVRQLQSAAGVGYPSERLTPEQSMFAKRALSSYNRAYYYARRTGDTDLLKQAYQQYMDELRSARIIP